MTLWLRDGKLVINSAGSPYDCGDCPCYSCFPCGNTGFSSVSVTFGYDGSATGGFDNALANPNCPCDDETYPVYPCCTNCEDIGGPFLLELDTGLDYEQACQWINNSIDVCSRPYSSYPMIPYSWASVSWREPRYNDPTGSTVNWVMSLNLGGFGYNFVWEKDSGLLCHDPSTGERIYYDCSQLGTVTFNANTLWMVRIVWPWLGVDCPCHIGGSNVSVEGAVTFS